MKTLLTGAEVLNVCTDTLSPSDILIEDGRILAVGPDLDCEPDRIIDFSGRTIVPGLIDSHMHVESTMMTPAHLSDILLEHGTTSIIADPHEIANVQGTVGIRRMIEQGRKIPLDIFWTLPSCVPATEFDVTGAVLGAEDLHPFWEEPDVIALAEVMNAPGVLNQDPDLMAKIRDAKAHHGRINGHAPGLSGRMLDGYIAAGITDDHECSTLAEAQERIEKGMTVFIREGTAARDLETLLGLFDDPWNRHCALCVDDRHPADLVREGHIDHVIRKAIALGKDMKTAVRMATIQPAEYYGLWDRGAITAGRRADLVILKDPETFEIETVFKNGIDIRELNAAPDPMPEEDTMHLDPVKPEAFVIDSGTEGPVPMRIIALRQGQLITDEVIRTLDLQQLPEGIVKAALLERHRGTGEVFVGLVMNTGLKQGAIASSIGHDAHNLIVIGSDDKDMALAANTVRTMKGGLCTVKDGKVLASMALPVAGLMAQKSARDLAEEEDRLQQSLKELGMDPEDEIFMTLSFMSLPVIPDLKLSTHGLVDVKKQEIVSLFAD